jgi:hypothetical protein
MKKFYILPTKQMLRFCLDLRTNSDYFLHKINRFVFITDKQSVYCAVRTESLCAIVVIPIL